MKKEKVSRYILFISIFSLITIFIFLVQQSYNKLIQPSVEISSSPLLKPIDPKLDVQVFDLIESKKNYQPEPSPSP